MIFLIFCIVLFFYLHIHFQLKTSNDLEVYDIDEPSKENLEEICDLRQPVIFKLNNNSFIEMCNRKIVGETYGAFDVNIRNVKEEHIEKNIYKEIELKKALLLTETDVEEKLIVENNSVFLYESGMIKQYKNNDSLLRPFMVSECKYDFLFGSRGSCTPFRYDVNYRNYYLVTEGSIRVKLAPPKSSKYLYAIDDYENFEFRSQINCWNVQKQYTREFNKVKCIEFTANKGQIVFIPAYWWISIRFETPTTTVCCFKYKTFMNTVSIFPRLFLYLLHKQNNIKVLLEKGFKKITTCNDTNNDNINDNISDNNTIHDNIDVAKIGDSIHDKDTNIESKSVTEIDATPIK